MVVNSYLLTSTATLIGCLTQQPAKLQPNLNHESEHPLPELHCPVDEWQPSESCKSLIGAGFLGQRRELGQKSAECAASGDPLAGYVAVLAKFMAAPVFQEIDYRSETQRYLDRATDCPACEALAYRDLGLSFALRAPIDLRAADIAFERGCTWSFKTNVTSGLSACVLLDSATSEYQKLKRRYHQTRQLCLDRNKLPPPSADWVVP